MENTVRIDKFLWSVRIFKTRSIAADECDKGKVTINNITVKPSREISKGAVFQVKDNPIYRKYKVLEILSKRVGAALVINYIEEITDAEELKKLEIHKSEKPLFIRERGTGRPTKKDRRDINGFFE